MYIYIYIYIYIYYTVYITPDDINTNDKYYNYST